MDIVFFQTADAFKYNSMLMETSRTVVEFCRVSGCAYESFVGIKRGVWPWQSTYNRIVQYHELMERGFTGWGIYLDADAYIVDLAFDIRAYLAEKSQYAAVLTPSMSTDHLWDVNAGVCLINLGHAQGRALVSDWYRRFRGVSDARLRDAETWLEADNDQDFLQHALRELPDVMQATFLQSTDLINSSYATFIRQHLRSYTADFDSRVRMIAAEVDRVFEATTQANIIDTLDPFIDSVARDLIAGLYEGLLVRKPDPDALRNGLASLNQSNLSERLQRLTREIIHSDEFRQRLSAGLV